MSDYGPTLCAQCANWNHVRDGDGLCRAHAPEPTARIDDIAHWPQSHGDEGCGEGRPARGSPSAVACRVCIFWRRSPNGLNPLNRIDKTMTWWQGAGHCVRLSPKPRSEPGNRAFWRVTHGDDGCAEGAARSL
jgi:hypothetical protein